MNYNIHPLIVHFPIALLFLYSVIKILPLRKWLPNVSWKHIERTLLAIGVLGALAALVTGPIAKALVQPPEQLVEAHATCALISVIIFSVLLLGEVIAWKKSRANFLSDGLFSKLLALAGFITITLTGMLGGVMVYGVSADPLAPMVLKMLGITF